MKSLTYWFRSPMEIRTELISLPPQLQGDDITSHVRTIEHWFDSNFSAIETLPRHLQLAARIEKLGLGLAEVRTELQRAFPDASADVIETAIARIGQTGSTAWLPSALVVRRELCPPSDRPLLESPRPAAAFGKSVSLLVLVFLAAALAITITWALH